MKIFIHIFIFLTFSFLAYSQGEEVVFSEAAIKVSISDTASWSWDIYKDDVDKSLGIYTNDQYVIIGIAITKGESLDESARFAEEIFEMSIGDVDLNWEESKFKGLPAISAEVEYLSQNQAFKSKVMIFQHPNGYNIQVGVLIQDELEEYEEQIAEIINSIEVIEK